MTDKNELLNAARQAVLDGDEEAAEKIATDGLAAGHPPLEMIDGGFVAGIREAGDLWEEGEFFLPELVTAAQAMKKAMAVLNPALAGEHVSSSAGKVVIGTVQGDIHDIGKTLVATLMAANGFSVVDEGADVPVEQFVTRAREEGADLVCASALLTTTMTRQKELADALAAEGFGGKLMVGGAPVTTQWAEQIGAAGHADNAVAAVDVARKLVGG